MQNREAADQTHFKSKAHFCGIWVRYANKAAWLTEWLKTLLHNF